MTNDEKIIMAGQDVWMLIAQEITDYFSASGMEEAQRSLLWAGFLSACTGTMTRDISLDRAKINLEHVAQVVELKIKERTLQ